MGEAKIYILHLFKCECFSFIFSGLPRQSDLSKMDSGRPRFSANHRAASDNNSHSSLNDEYDHHHNDTSVTRLERGVDDDDAASDEVNNAALDDDEAGFSRRRSLFLVLLFDLLFAIILFIVFLIFLTAAADETKSALMASRLDFARLLPHLEAGSCFAPVLSLARNVSIAVAPHHQYLVQDVQSVLLKQSNDDLVRLFSTCESGVALQVCLLKKTCPHFEISVEANDGWPVHLSEDESKRRRFDLVKSKAKMRRANFVDKSNYSTDLDFCNALFSYVLLTTSLAQTSNLVENYTLSLDEPHEVEHLLLIFLSEPIFAGIRERAGCGRSDIQCLLETMCDYEVYRDAANGSARDDWEIFQGFMEEMLSTCNGEPCKNNKWIRANTRGWFSSCWLRRGRFSFVIPWDKVNVTVPVFRRPCDEAQWTRDYSIIFGVASVYIFILAFSFLFLELLVLFLYRRCADHLTRLASIKILLASSASIVPSLRPSRRTTPRSSPRGSQRSFSDHWRGRFARARRSYGQGGQGGQFSFLGSLTGISNSQSARGSVDSGLGFNTRLSTPRSASIPHLRMAYGLPGRRFKASNEYVFPAFEAGSMSVLPTPITRPPTVRRSFSTREEPVLNFLSESVIDGGGEILERGDGGVEVGGVGGGRAEDHPHAVVDVVIEESLRPPRPRSTPNFQREDQSLPPVLPERLQPRQPNPPPAYNSIAFDVAAPAVPPPPPRERLPPAYSSLSFAALDYESFDVVDRSVGATLRDSGVESSHLSNPSFGFD